MCVLAASLAGTTPSANAITPIPAGTIAAETDGGRWNRVVMMAIPRIASGDVDALSGAIRESVSSLHLTVMASVQSNPDGRGYRLANVGVGYSTPIKNRQTIIDPESASDLGASLGFIGGRMLATNQAQIAKVRVVVRSTTLTIFDAPAIYLRNEKHQGCLARHLIWLEPVSGRLMLATWLMENQQREIQRTPIKEGRLAPWPTPIRLVSAGTREDRRIHVDGREFSFLGIPTERAFAVEDLPPGRNIAWTEDLEKSLCLVRYDAEQLRTLAEAINQSVASLAGRTNE